MPNNSTLQIHTVSFFGHRHIDNFEIIENRLKEIIISLISEHGYICFLVGKNGDFDQIVSSTIRRIKRNYMNDNFSHTLVLPYDCAEFQNNYDNYSEYYDDIEICTKAVSAHFKAAIQVRNRQMVDRSDLIICYVENNSGGAYQTIKYALKHNKKIINLAEE